MVKVLFVCLGNICRSPTAQGVLTKLVADQGLAEEIAIDSAGTHAYHVGEPPDRRAQQAAARRGVDMSMLTARRVYPQDFADFDYLLAMDRENLENLRAACPPEHAHKLHLFMSFAPEAEVEEVPDPYYSNRKGFERVLDLVESAAHGLLHHIQVTDLAGGPGALPAVAVLGAGLMGQPLAGRLLEGGYPVHVYNRSPEKTADLAAQGAKVAQRVEQAVSAAECVVLMLTDADAIREVLLGPAVRARLAGKTVIQMGTIAPAESRALGEEVAGLGGDYLEATVLGSIPEARAGTLIVMVGGEEADFQRWSELLRRFGPDPQLIGPVGQAAALKLALNQLIAGLTASFALSLGMVRNAGIDVERFMGLLRDSAVYAPTFDKKLSRMLDRDYANPNFPTRHLLKDVRLFVDAAQEMGLATPALEGVGRILEQALERGLAEVDYSALYDVVDPR